MPQAIQKYLAFSSQTNDVDARARTDTSSNCARILLEAGAKATAKPSPPPVKIFIVGNPSVGSLTKSLQTETSTLKAALSFITGPRLVPNVEQKTAGIIPSQFTSRSFGQVTFFDFAGQQEYYASHAALLKASISSTTPVFIIVADLRDSIEEIEVFWLTFLANQCTTFNTKPHVLIVGSHSDEVRSRGEELRTKVNLHTLNDSFNSDVFMIDCHEHSSRDMGSRLKIICETIRKKLDEFSRLHYLFFFLLQVSCEEVRTKTCFIHVSRARDSIATYYESCVELDKTGCIVYIKNCNKLKSWIVLTGLCFRPCELQNFICHFYMVAYVNHKI